MSHGATLILFGDRPYYIMSRSEMTIQKFIGDSDDSSVHYLIFSHSGEFREFKFKVAVWKISVLDDLATPVATGGNG